MGHLRVCTHTLAHSCTHMCTHTQGYYEELAHMVTKAEKSQDLQLSSEGPRRANGVSSRLCSSLKVGEDPYPSLKTVW